MRLNTYHIAHIMYLPVPDEDNAVTCRHRSKLPSAQLSVAAAQDAIRVSRGGRGPDWPAHGLHTEPYRLRTIKHAETGMMGVSCVFRSAICLPDWTLRRGVFQLP